MISVRLGHTCSASLGHFPNPNASTIFPGAFAVGCGFASYLKTRSSIATSAMPDGCLSARSATRFVPSVDEMCTRVSNIRKVLRRTKLWCRLCLTFTTHAIGQERVQSQHQTIGRIHEDVEQPTCSTPRVRHSSARFVDDDRLSVNPFLLEGHAPTSSTGDGRWGKRGRGVQQQREARSGEIGGRRAALLADPKLWRVLFLCIPPRPLFVQITPLFPHTHNTHTRTCCISVPYQYPRTSSSAATHELQATIIDYLAGSSLVYPQLAEASFQVRTDALTNEVLFVFASIRSATTQSTHQSLAP